MGLNKKERIPEKLIKVLPFNLDAWAVFCDSEKESFWFEKIIAICEMSEGAPNFRPLFYYDFGYYSNETKCILPCSYDEKNFVGIVYDNPSKLYTDDLKEKLGRSWIYFKEDMENAIKVKPIQQIDKEESFK